MRLRNDSFVSVIDVSADAEEDLYGVGNSRLQAYLDILADFLVLAMNYYLGVPNARLDDVARCSLEAFLTGVIDLYSICNERVRVWIARRDDGGLSVTQVEFVIPTVH